MRVRRSIAITAAAMLAFTAAAVGIANASETSINGRIAYGRDQAGNTDVYAARQDGKYALRLTTAGVVDTLPAYSADGHRVAWVRKQGRYAYELWTMDADGTSKHRIYSNTAGWLYAPPQWSPDGQRVTFSIEADVADGYYGGHRIFTMAADGTDLRQLTQEWNPSNDTGTSLHMAPTYSPDGSKIAYIRLMDDASWRSEVRVMNVDGSDDHLVVGFNRDSTRIYTVGWSPDGTRLVYDLAGQSEFAGQPRGEIWIVDADGSNNHLLPVPNQLKYGAVWSPDGTRIAYERPGKGIYTARTDGSDERLLRAEQIAMYSLSWQRLPG